MDMSKVLEENKAIIQINNKYTALRAEKTKVSLATYKPKVHKWLKPDELLHLPNKQYAY